MGFSEEMMWIGQTESKLMEKFTAVADRTKSNLPFIPIQGRYRDCMMPGGVAWWTNGFWPGILWTLYQVSGEERFASYAREAEERMEAILENPEKTDHDLGFLFQLSAGLDYRITGREKSRKTLIQAADLLLKRFHEKGQYIQAWNHHPAADDVRGWAIIDCMMNLPLLFTASQITGDDRYAAVARAHADTTLKYLLREDGSNGHIMSFDPETGDFLEILGGQGYSKDSSWSRGQGWALYGFTVAYEYTGKEEYLQAAKRSAAYCALNLMANDFVPFEDFRQPHDPVILDSGAGAVIASGLLELASVLPEDCDLEKRSYFRAAVKTLKACSDRFGDYDPDKDGFLTQGSTAYHDTRLNGHAFVYNDYFFLEAIFKLKQKIRKAW